MNSITKKCRKCKREKEIQFFSLTYKNLCLECLEDVISPYRTDKPVFRVPVSEKEHTIKRVTNNRGRFVYFIRGGNLTKIGIADDVESRLHDFNLGSPVELTVIHSFWVENALAVEKSLHIKFKNKWIRREWFSLSDDDIEWIKSTYP